MSKNKTLSAAKSAKNDEFYTQLVDIQNGINAYLDYDLGTFSGDSVLSPSNDDIGNLTHFSSVAITNAYSANCLNQYVSISSGASRPGEPDVATTPSSMLAYDIDGNLVSDGVFRYSYDAENRLVAVRSASLTNGAIRVLNSYDHNDRRVRKTVQRLMLPASVPPAPPQSGEWTTTEAHTFFYDDWNLIEERISRDDGTDFTNRYIWGKDISGSLQGAGGVGGLVAVSRNGLHYFPSYDNNGNVTQYLDESGTVVAAYTYDAFGRTLSATGPLANLFPHRFSTKYFDPETGLYYYGYRFYSPELMRWMNRDPIAEHGGINLYHFSHNNPIFLTDSLGLRCTQNGNPYLLPREIWHIDKIDFDYHSQSHMVILFGLTVNWRICGEVLCCCSGRTVKKKTYKFHKTHVSFETNDSPVLGWDPTYKGTFDIPMPTTATEAISDLLASFAERMTGSRFLMKPEDILRIKDAVKQSAPQSDSGKWPDHPCQ